MKNGVATIFSVIGVFIIVGFGFAGYGIGQGQQILNSHGFMVNQPFNWYAALPVFVTGFIIGILFIGVSEVIDLLQRNLNASEAILKNTDSLKGRKVVKVRNKREAN